MLRQYIVFRYFSKYLLTSAIQSVIQYLETFLNTILPRKGSDVLSFAETFKALSDPARREILELLKNGRLSAGEIAANFAMTQATVSYHLKILKKADLVRETREKNFIYYELNLTVLEEIMVWLSDLKGEQ